jgi:hypothetical protein
MTRQDKRDNKALTSMRQGNRRNGYVELQGWQGYGEIGQQGTRDNEAEEVGARVPLGQEAKEVVVEWLGIWTRR